jgi:hypothetical protein
LMNFLGIPWTGRKRFHVWAALCTAIANGSDERYPSGAKHAILAMVRSPALKVEDSVIALLTSNGWCEPEITRIKQLEEPFRSEDQDMLACHNGAIHKEGGLIIYSDPIADAV